MRSASSSDVVVVMGVLHLVASMHCLATARKPYLKSLTPASFRPEPLPSCPGHRVALLDEDHRQDHDEREDHHTSREDVGLAPLHGLDIVEDGGRHDARTARDITTNHQHHAEIADDVREPQYRSR